MRNIIYLCIITVLFIGCSSNKEMVSVVIHDDKGQNIITAEGEKVLRESFDKVYTYNDEYVKIEKNDKVGIANYAGEVLLDPIYDSISFLYNDYAIVVYDNQYGLLNNDMKVVLEPQLQDIQIKDGFFIVKKDSKEYCMNESFELFSKNYDHIYYFQDGFARVELDEKFGFINEECEEVLSVTYDYASDFINGFAKVEIKDKFSYVNKNMEIITKEAYKNTYFFKGK